MQGLRSINGSYRIDRGDVKNSIRNGEAKKLICMAHGHELRGWGGNVYGRGCVGQRRIEGGKWDNS